MFTRDQRCTDPTGVTERGQGKTSVMVSVVRGRTEVSETPHVVTVPPTVLGGVRLGPLGCVYKAK